MTEISDDSVDRTLESYPYIVIDIDTAECLYAGDEENVASAIFGVTSYQKATMVERDRIGVAGLANFEKMNNRPAIVSVAINNDDDYPVNMIMFVGMSEVRWNEIFKVNLEEALAESKAGGSVH